MKESVRGALGSSSGEAPVLSQPVQISAKAATNSAAARGKVVCIACVMVRMGV
jgi:hypothetical protein